MMIEASKVKPGDIIHLATPIAERDARVKGISHSKYGVYLTLDDPKWGIYTIGFSQTSLIEMVSLTDRYPGQQVCRICGKIVCPHFLGRIEEWG